MANMKDLLRDTVPVSTPIVITLNNGKETAGHIVSYEESFLLFCQENQLTKPISYDLIGTYDFLEELEEKAKANQPPATTAQAAIEELRDAKVELAALCRDLVAHGGKLQKECGGTLDALLNAVKIKETDGKFERTPRVFAKLRQVAQGGSAPAELLVLLGETALLTGDGKTGYQALEMIGRDWTPENGENRNLMRVVSALSVSLDDDSFLCALRGTATEKSRPNLVRAMLYFRQETERETALENEGDVYDPANDKALFGTKVAAPPQKVAPKNGALPEKSGQSGEMGTLAPPAEDEEVGKVSFYDPERRYGTLRCENLGSMPFLMSNVADEKLLDLLESGNAKKLDPYIAFRCKDFMDRKRKQVRPTATGLRLCGQPSNHARPITEDQVKLKRANDLFIRGKENDNETLKLYTELLEDGFHDSTVLNNLVSLYQRTANSPKAVELLEKYKKDFGEEHYYGWLYQAYMQMDHYDEAIEAEKQIIKLSKSPSGKLHHLLSMTKLLYGQGKYEQTIEACLQWLQVKVKRGNGNDLAQQSVGLAYGEKQVHIFIARSIVALRNQNEGYQADLKVLAILENDEDAQKVLNEEEREGENPAEGGSRIFGDFRDNIGPLANREIREVKLSDCVDLRKLNERGYAGTLEEAKKDAEKLTQNMSTQKPYSRYQNSIAGARVLYDALDNPENRREEQMAEKRSELEGVLFGYLTKALVSLADDMVGRREVDLSVARYYYIEALKYSRTDEQDKQNAITRAILSAVVPRGKIPLLLDKDRNISLTNQLKDGLMKTKKVPAAEVLDLLARIYDATLVDKDKLLKKLCGVIFDAKKGPLFFEPGSAEAYTETALYLRVRERSRSYKRQENEWRAMAKQLLREFSLAPNWLAGAQERFLQQADLLECVDLLDKKRIDEFRSLLIKTVEYNQMGKYSLKEDGLRNLAGRLDELELSIEEHPTKYAFETLLEIIETWRRVISDTLSELYQSRPPELQCKMIAEDGLHIGENSTISIQLDVTNAPDRQTADSVVIQVIESEEYQVVTPLERKYYIAENNGETIKVTLGGFRETVKAFSVTVEIGYEYNLTEKETAKETRSFNLSVNLGDADFSELENPYEAYAGGATVDDEEMVFGRKDFIERIVNSIKGRDGVPLRRKTIALYGQKRAGKSTILYHLKLALQKEAKNTIVVDLGDCAKLEGDIFEYSLYRTLFKRLGDALKKEHPALQQALLEAGITVPTRAMLKSVSVGRELLEDFFTEFNDFVQRTPAFSQYNVVLMIDEFTNIYIRLCHGKIDSDFMQYWKAIINDYGIVGVVVGQDYMQDFVNAYPNPFAAIDLRQVTYLPEEETRRMITAAPISAEGHRAVFDGLSGERAIQKILQLTACSAYFTMILLDRLMKYLNKMRQTYVTDADIDHLLSDDLLSGSEQINLPRFEFLYNDDGDISDVTRPRHNMVVLWTIVRQFTALGRCKRDDIVFAPELRVAEISPERIDDLLSKLVSRDVLSMDVNGNYSIRIGLFAEWLGRNCSAETINQIKDTVG